MPKKQAVVKRSNGNISITIENNLKANQSGEQPTKRRRKKRTSTSASNSALQDILRGGGTVGGKVLGGGLPPSSMRPTVDVSYIRPPPQSYSIWNDTTVPSNVGVGYAQAQQMGLINTPQPQPQSTVTASRLPQKEDPLAQFKPEMKDSETQGNLDENESNYDWGYDEMMAPNRYTNDETQSLLSANDIAPRYDNPDPLNTTFNLLNDFSQQSRYIEENEESITIPTERPSMIEDEEPITTPSIDKSPEYNEGYDIANTTVTNYTLRNRMDKDFRDGFKRYIKDLLTGSDNEWGLVLETNNKKFETGYNVARSLLFDNFQLNQRNPDFKEGYMNFLESTLKNETIERKTQKQTPTQFEKDDSNKTDFEKDENFKVDLSKHTPKRGRPRKKKSDEELAKLADQKFYKEGVRLAKEGFVIPDEEFSNAPTPFLKGYYSVLSLPETNENEEVVMQTRPKRGRPRKKTERFSP